MHPASVLIAPVIDNTSLLNQLPQNCGVTDLPQPHVIETPEGPYRLYLINLPQPWYFDWLFNLCAEYQGVEANWHCCLKDHSGALDLPSTFQAVVESHTAYLLGIHPIPSMP